MSQGYSGPPQSSGGGGGTVLVIVLVVAGLLGLGCLGVCGLGMLGLSWGGRQVSQAANQAMPLIQDAINEGMLQVQIQAAVATNAEVVARVGEPLSFSPITNPPAYDSATATFEFEVGGSKDKGNVHADALREGAQWKIAKLEVRFADGSIIEIDPGQTFSTTTPVESPILPPEITDPPQSPDPLPDEPIP